MAFITKSSNPGAKAALFQERVGWSMFTDNSGGLDSMNVCMWKFGSPDNITEKRECVDMSLNRVLIVQHPLVRINQ